MKRFIALSLVCLMSLGLCACSKTTSETTAAETGSETASEVGPVVETEEETVDLASLESYDIRTLGDDWVYNETISIDTGETYVEIPYYAMEDVVYCTDPVNEEYEIMHIYVPACYMTEGENGPEIDPDGTFEWKTEDGETMTIGSSEAPIICLNKITGYAAGVAPKIGDKRMGQNAGYMYQFLEQGFVVVSMSSRGSTSTDADGNCDGTVPAGLVDLKAGMRWLSYNDEYMAGDAEKIVTIGVSAGGGISALLGASGNSELFDSYLDEIGAAPGSDAVWASVCYCPITNLEFADGCAWWQYAAEEGDSFEAAVSQKVYDLYVEYVQSLGFDLGDDGRSGEFYEGFKEAFEAALNAHIERDLGGDEAAAAAWVLEKDPTGEWLSYSKEDGVKITSVEDYCRKYWVSSPKSIATFDTVGLDSMEASVFSGKHYSWIMTEAFESLADSYTEAKEYAEVYSKDVYDDGEGELAALYDPMTFIGQDNSDVASNWRFQIGSEDTNITQACAWLLYNMLEETEDVNKVNYDILYGIGHQTVEYDPYDVITWVYECAFDAAPEYDNIAEVLEKEAETPDASDVQSADTVAGTYTYSEVNGAGMNVTWTLDLKADGTYTLSESGIVEKAYTGNFCVVGGLVSCGPINEADGPRGDSFGEGYTSVWSVDSAAGTCAHEAITMYVDPESVK